MKCWECLEFARGSWGRRVAELVRVELAGEKGDHGAWLVFLDYMGVIHDNGHRRLHDGVGGVR